MEPNVKVDPSKAGAHPLLETITGTEEIAHQLSLLHSMCAQKACMREYGGSYDLASIATAGLVVGKIQIYDARGVGTFQKEVVLEIIDKYKKTSKTQLAYLIFYPETKEGAAADNSAFEMR